MAYKELIKNFDKIRDYMREFYVYGFKSRDEYHQKSSRSYDDERRRVESWLDGYMGFRNTAEGKNVFISVDSRQTAHNPLYQAWKAKSFTDRDITLHFILFDILYNAQTALTFSEIAEKIYSDYLSHFTEQINYDDSTVRKKLKEYTEEGLIITEKRGKTLLYRRSSVCCDFPSDAADFFSEIMPCGVIGSFILDQTGSNSRFSFKHHYITHAIDSEILFSLFSAMRNKCETEIKNLSRKSNEPKIIKIIPLRILMSVQSGRQYLIAYRRNTRRIISFRIDYILSVRKLNQTPDFDELRSKLDGMQKLMWGVSTQGGSGRTETVEFTLKYHDDETYIVQRLLREKRCGTVELLDGNKCRFYAEVYDSNELLPWIRTFICRIVEIRFSNIQVENKFRADLEEMYRMYEV